MKALKCLGLGTAVLAAAMVVNVHGETLLPGQVDFGNFTPPSAGGEFVEVNVTGTLISLASRLVEKSEPEVAKLLNGLQMVKVNVIGLDDTNRSDLQKRAEKICQELGHKGWERLVVARKQDQDVSVFLKTHNKDTVQGLAVIVLDGNKQAVFINVVGDIKPEQLALLGERLHIDQLKKAGEAAQQHKD